MQSKCWWNSFQFFKISLITWPGGRWEVGLEWRKQVLAISVATLDPKGIFVHWAIFEVQHFFKKKFASFSFYTKFSPVQVWKLFFPKLTCKNENGHLTMYFFPFHWLSDIVKQGYVTFSRLRITLGFLIGVRTAFQNTVDENKA